MEFYQVSTVDFGKSTLFWDIPKWNMRVSKWDRGSVKFQAKKHRKNKYRSVIVTCHKSPDGTTHHERLQHSIVNLHICKYTNTQVLVNIAKTFNPFSSDPTKHDANQDWNVPLARLQYLTLHSPSMSRSKGHMETR